MRERRLVALTLVALVAGMGAVAWISPSAVAECGAKNACDANLFAVVGQRLLSGGDPYAPVPLPGVELPFLYPPTSLPLFAAWGLAAPKIAHVLVATVSTALLLAAVARRAGPLAAVPAGIGGWTFLSAFLGQTGTLLGAACVALLGGEVVGGAALGLVLLKPHYGLCVAAACVGAGRWRALGVAALVTLLLGGVSLAAFGAAPWAGWFALLGQPHPERDSALMSNWFALAPAAWRVAAPVVYAAALVGSLAAGRRLPWPHALAVALCLAAALVPHGHPYDLAVWVVPALALGGRVTPRIAGLGVLVLAGVWLDARPLLALTSLVLAGVVATRGAPSARREAAVGQ